MTGAPLDLAFFGLTLSSSWGNGHATTYRALARGLRALGHRVTFYEREQPWYAANRDMGAPDFCRLVLYDDPLAMLRAHGAAIDAADALIVGSYVPEGAALIDALARRRPARLCFYDIDTPVTLAALARDAAEGLERRQLPLFDAYFSFSGGPALERLRDLGARRPVALYCSVDPERHAPTGAAPLWDLGYLGTYSPDRQPALERLLIGPARRLPDLRFVVAGPQYPPDIDWPPNVERIEHLPPDAHAGFYSRQRFTLNVTRADMRALGWSPSVRLFEAAACGTPVVSDVWPGLDDVLPVGEAILTAETSEDVARLLTGADDARRRAVAAAARRIVLARHTGAARAAEMVAALAAPAPAMAGGGAS